MVTDNKRLTKYQVELLQLVAAGNPDREEGGCIDFDQLLEKLSWKPTKASCHFSIRALIKRGLLLKTPDLMLRRGRQRVGFVLSESGRLALDPREGVVETPKDISIPGVPEPVLEAVEEDDPGVQELLEDL